jgi:hypothetical protein
MALNLVGRPLGDLFGPLDHHQVAPAGWLVVEKSAVLLLGDGELALRLVPFVSSLVALPLFVMLARRVLTGPAVPLAVGLFALGIPFVFYGAQLKLYAGDVAAALALTVVALDARRDGMVRRRVVALGLTGAVLPWVSLAASFVLAGVGLSLFGLALCERDRRTLRALSLVGILWVASGLGALVLARSGLTEADHAYFQRFWAGAFWPWPPRDLEDWIWPIARVASVFGGGGLRYPLPGWFAVLGAVGVAALWRTRRVAALLLLSPVGVALAAAAAQLYPFATRVVLGLVPALLVCVAGGAEWLRTARRPAWRRVGAVAMVLTAALALHAILRYPPPYRPEHLKPVLAAVARERRPGDRMYVYYGGEKAFRYYATRFGFRDDEFVMGGCWRDAPRAYLRELDQFRGASRVWIVLTHARPELEEEQLIVGYLDRIGIRLAVYRWTPRPRDGRTAGAVGYLYGLSDPARLASASAATFPVPARSGEGLAWSC